MHISHERSTPRFFVDVVEDQNSRCGRFKDSGPEIASITKQSSGNRRTAAAQATSHRVPHHRTGVRKHATHLAIGETRIAQSDIKFLDRVCDHAGIELAKSIELLFRQQRCTCHPAPSRASCFAELSASIGRLTRSLNSRAYLGW